MAFAPALYPPLVDEAWFPEPAELNDKTLLELENKWDEKVWLPLSFNVHLSFFHVLLFS